MRYRSRESTDQTFGTHQIATISGGGPILTLKKEEMWDEVTANWSKVSQGLVKPVNPMIRSKSGCSYSSALDYKRNSTGAAYSNTGPCLTGAAFNRSDNLLYTKTFTSPTITADVDALKSELLVRAVADARESAMDALTFAAEFNKTVSLISGFGKRSLKRWETVKSIARGRGMRTERDLLKLAADLWLEYRYGWRILYYDMLAINEAYQKLDQLAGPLKRGTAKATLSASGSTSTSSWTNTPTFLTDQTRNMPFIKAQWSTTPKSDMTVRAGVGIRVYGRDLTYFDPLVTAWELLRFSFIIDWFVTIGENVKAFYPIASGGVLYSWVSTELKNTNTSTTEVAPLYTSGSSAVTITAASISSESWTESYNREERDAHLYLTKRLNLSPAKLIDLIAIFAGIKLQMNRYSGNTAD